MFFLDSLGMLSVYALIILVFFVILFLNKALYIVKQAEVIIIERLGKYHRTLYPGLHVVIPFLDTPHASYWTHVVNIGGKYHYQTYAVSRIELRESVYDFPKQNVITKDNVGIEINALLYFQITDPKAAVYEIVNLPQAIEKLTQTALRNLVGSMDLDATLVSRDSINEKLQIILDEATDKWGVKVNRVELQEVNPPKDIQHAMEKQMRAERDRRAIILESEGKKQAAILQAEGEQESNILRAKGVAQANIVEAEGKAQARLKIAQADSDAIGMIQKAVPNGNPLPYIIATEYIKALPEITKGKDNKMIIVPYESSALLGSLSTIKQIFEQKSDQ